MMPTRLQDGVSVALLQWMRSAGCDEKCDVFVRIGENWSMDQMLKVFENAGMVSIEVKTALLVKGSVTPDVLSRIARCMGVCAVTAAKNIEY